MKKFFAAMLAILMIASLSTVALAADTYTITINKEEEGHVYEAYQIFVGDISEDEEGKLILTNIQWGTGVTEEGKTALGDAAAKADTLDTQADAEAFAQEIEQYLTTTSTHSVYNAEDKNYTISGLVGGYYLIKDRDNSLPDEKGYTAYMMKVIGDTSATPKDGETTVVKKVDDKNDSNTQEDSIEWHDSADHDVGDLIDFKLEATIAKNYAQYTEAYYLAFHDTEDKGLTFQPNSVKVYVDGTLITTGYTLDTDPADGHTFDVIFADLKAIDTVKAGSTITVTYQSQLNQDAVLGNQGNVNKVYGEFSNSPNNEQRGKTPEDTVIVFTYKVEVNKVDEELEPLSGATFTLEKFVTDANGTAELNGVQGTWVAISTVETEPDTTFTFSGLDDGSYRLTETEAPEHYNKIEPINFVVTAAHDILWETQGRTDVLTGLTGEVATGELTFTSDVATGEVAVDVVNERGLILPETGGMGTTLFYVFGTFLAMGAVVFLVTKKRMAAHS